MIMLRSALFNLWFYGMTTVLLLGSLFLGIFSPAVAISYARLWARLSVGGLRVLCGIRWEVSGLEDLPTEEPILIASMHQSAFDTLIWLVLQPRFAYVFKQELGRIPLFGGMLRRTGMIEVNRSAGAAALRDLLRAADRAVAERRQIVIFPEGTRVVPGVRAKLHPGVAAIAARTKLPVYPVVTDSGLCWGRRAFRKYPGTIHIVVQKPLEAGLRRDVLLERLAASFAEGSARLAQTVDNSVGDAATRLPARAS